MQPRTLSQSDPNPKHEAQVWPEPDLEAVAMCPVCGSGHRKIVHTALRDTTFFVAPGEWDLYRCEDCRCCYIDPRPTQASIHLAYSQYFTHTSVPGATQPPPQSLVRKFRRSLANGYRNWRYSTNYLPATKFGIALAFLLPSMRHRVDATMRFLRAPRPGNRLLDIGAGNGSFLLEARESGWDVVGVEPDPSAVEAAHRAGLDVRAGDIHSIQEGFESFDAITMNHVLEHLHDPNSALKAAFKLLHRNGVLFIETPNIDSQGHLEFGRNWRGLESPRHLVLFNWEALEEALKCAGFTRIKRMPRRGVYPILCAKSRAIEKNCDPEAVSRSSSICSLVDSLKEVRVAFNYRRSEFISILAERR